MSLEENGPDINAPVIQSSPDEVDAPLTTGDATISASQAPAAIDPLSQFRPGGDLYRSSSALPAIRTELPPAFSNISFATEKVQLQSNSPGLPGQIPGSRIETFTVQNQTPRLGLNSDKWAPHQQTLYTNDRTKLRTFDTGIVERAPSTSSVYVPGAGSGTADERNAAFQRILASIEQPQVTIPVMVAAAVTDQLSRPNEVARTSQVDKAPDAPPALAVAAGNETRPAGTTDVQSLGTGVGNGTRTGDSSVDIPTGFGSPLANRLTDVQGRHPSGSPDHAKTTVTGNDTSAYTTPVGDQPGRQAGPVGTAMGGQFSTEQASAAGLDAASVAVETAATKIPAPGQAPDVTQAGLRAFSQDIINRQFQGYQNGAPILDPARAQQIPPDKVPTQVGVQPPAPQKVALVGQDPLRTISVATGQGDQRRPVQEPIVSVAQNREVGPTAVATSKAQSTKQTRVEVSESPLSLNSTIGNRTPEAVRAERNGVLPAEIGSRTVLRTDSRTNPLIDGSNVSNHKVLPGQVSRNATSEILSPSPVSKTAPQMVSRAPEGTLLPANTKARGLNAPPYSIGQRITDTTARVAELQSSGKSKTSSEPGVVTPITERGRIVQQSQQSQVVGSQRVGEAVVASKRPNGHTELNQPVAPSNRELAKPGRQTSNPIEGPRPARVEGTQIKTDAAQHVRQRPVGVDSSIRTATANGFFKGEVPRAERVPVQKGKVSDGGHISTSQKGVSTPTIGRGGEAIVPVSRNIRTSVPANEVQPGNIVKVKGEATRTSDGAKSPIRVPGVRSGAPGDGDLVVIKGGKQTVIKAGERTDAAATPGIKASGLKHVETTDSKLVNGVLVSRKLGGEKGEGTASAATVKAGSLKAGTERTDAQVASKTAKASTVKGEPGLLGTTGTTGTTGKGIRAAGEKAATINSITGKGIRASGEKAATISSNTGKGIGAPGEKAATINSTTKSGVTRQDGRFVGGSVSVVGERAQGKEVASPKTGTATTAADRGHINAAAAQGLKAGDRGEVKATGTRSAAVKSFVAPLAGEKGEGKSISAPKFGVAKLAGEKADKSISTVKFGDVKTTAERAEGKSISAAKHAVIKLVGIENSAAKSVGKVAVAAAAAAADKVESKKIAAVRPSAKGGSASDATTTVAGKTFTGKISAQRTEAIIAAAKQGAGKQPVSDKSDARPSKVAGKISGAKAEEGKAEGRKQDLRKADNVKGNSVDKAMPASRNGKAGSVGVTAERADARAIKSSVSPISRTGGEKIDGVTSKGRPMDAVAKIFGIALGVEKAGAQIKDSNTTNAKVRSEADKVEAKDKSISRDKAIAKADDILARRVVGAGSQSTEATNLDDGDDSVSTTDDLRKKKEITGKRNPREGQVIDKLHWMIQVAEAGLNFGDRRAAKVSGNQESKVLLKQTGRRRRRYTVKYGDNIRSIARVQLGDERYAQLIITINRGSAGFYMLPDNKTPHLLVDQVIWLPSDAELEIHKKHFFARGTQASGEQSFAPAISVVSPEAITVPEVEMEKVNLPEVEFMQGDNTDAYDVTPTTVSYEKDQHEVATFLHRLRSAGCRQAISLQDFEDYCGDTTQKVEPAKSSASDQPSDRRVYRVRLGDTLRSIALRDPLLQDQSMWPLLARINGISEVRDATGHPTATLSRGNTIYLPSEEEIKQYRLMSRLASHANNATQCTAETDFLSMAPERNDAHSSIQRLSHSCRINSVENCSDDAFVSKLEMQIGGEWITVATYDYRHGHAFRYIHRKNGSIAAFPMDLPLEIVREMASEDFARNWTTYCIDFATVPSNAVSRSS